MEDNVVYIVFCQCKNSPDIKFENAKTKNIMILNTDSDGILDFQNEVKSLKSRYVIVCDVSMQETFHGRFVSNNIVAIDYDSFNEQKLKNMVNWILTGFGKDSGMDRLFFCADLHFNHANIIKYCNRPWNSGKNSDGETVVSPEDVEKMNETLISNWNSVVSEDDTVVVNGDFCLGDRSKIPEIVSRLNGHKQLVIGNHDWFNYDKNMYSSVVDFFYKAGFEYVSKYPIIMNGFVIVSHEPLPWIDANSPYLSIYGHVHTSEMYKDFTKNTFCDSIERTGYKPISLSEIVSKCKSCE